MLIIIYGEKSDFYNFASLLFKFESGPLIYKESNKTSIHSQDSDKLKNAFIDVIFKVTRSCFVPHEQLLFRSELDSVSNIVELSKNSTIR